MATHIIEITLISAQGLKSPSSKMRRMQTYALAWIDSSLKLRTRIDRTGAENPFWNEKLLFKVDPEFLSSETSAVSIEIYAVGYIVDRLVGAVRCLVSNIPNFSAATKTPSFTALQIRRPSGNFRGVLNIAAMLIDGSDFAGLAAFSEVSAIVYRELTGESQHKERVRKLKLMAELDAGDDESWENSSCAGSQYSDGGDSTTSSSSATSTVLKDWNGVNCLAGKNRLRSASESMLCGLLMERKARSIPSDENSDV